MSFIIIFATLLTAFAQVSFSELKIVGGHNAAKGAFPFMAVMKKYPNSYFCSGAIISDDIILTNGGCVQSKYPRDFFVWVGSNKLDEEGTTYSISGFRISSHFDPIHIKYQMGMIFLSKPIQYNKFVQPIPLETNFVKGNVKVNLTGWGRLEEDGEIANDLQVLELKTITNKECAKTCDTFNEIVEGQICTLPRKGQGACTDDRGSALVANGKLIGIYPQGSPCAIGYPDVYLRVSSYVEWIEESMNP